MLERVTHAAPRPRRGAADRAWLGAVMLAALAAVLWISLRRDAGSALEPGHAEGSRELAERGELREAEPRRPLADPRGAERIEVSSTPRSRSSAAAPSIAGVVRVFDHTGAPVRPPDGELGLAYVDPGVQTGLLVELADGRFRLPAEPGDLILAQPLAVAGRYAFVEGPPERVVPEDAPLVLVYRIPPPLTLRVTSTATGAELPAATVVHESADPRRAAPDTTLARDARSPISLASLDAPATLLVGAPGHAWRAIAVDPRGGGDLTARLEPAGELRVLVEGELTSPDARVRIGALSSPQDSLGDAPVEAGEARFDGLAAGDYVATLVHGRDATVIAWDLAHVAVGRTTELILAPPATSTPSAGRRVEVDGLIALPPRVDARDVELSFLPAEDGYRRAEVTLAADELRPTPEGLAFEATLRPVRYGWEIRAWGLRGEVVLDDRARQRVVIEPPPFARVDVELLDHVPDDLVGAHLTWCSPAAARPHGIYWFYEEFDADGRAGFLAPLGPIELSVVTPTHPEVVLRERVADGGTRVAIPLVPATGVRVFASDAKTGERLEPWYDLVPLGHGGAIRGWGEPQDGADAWVFLDTPGRYRLIADAVFGYAPLAPVEFDVEPGRWSRVDLVFEPVDVRVDR